MKKKCRPVWLFFLPATAVMLLIFVHSAMDAEQSLAESNWFTAIIDALFPGAFSAGQLTFFVRKAGHVTEYLLLGLTLLWGFVHFDVRNKALLAWCIGTAYAVTDEIHQLFVPGRSCEFRDICIDAAGVLAGVLIASAVLKAKRKNETLYMAEQMPFCMGKE